MPIFTRLAALSLIAATASAAHAQSNVVSTPFDGVTGATATTSIAPVAVAMPLMPPPASRPLAPSSTASGSTIGMQAMENSRHATGVSASGAPLTGLRSAVHAPESDRALSAPPPPTHANLGQARAMMVVGVVGFVAGAIIGGSPGTVVMVGAAAVGLYGLYDYLK